MPKKSNLVGRKFHRLLVVSFAFASERGRRNYICRCDCGTEKIIPGRSMVSGGIMSCGCYRLERTITHGQSNTSTYRSWQHMLTRCLDSKSDSFQLYGGRGITVCEQWKNSFENFLADMGERPQGTSLDRRNSDGNYEPSNCRWASSQIQTRNRRSNRYLDFDGQSRCIADWAKCIGITRGTLTNRLRRGWSIEKALTTIGGK